MESGRHSLAPDSRPAQGSDSRPEARLGVAMREAREARGLPLRALARTLRRSRESIDSRAPVSSTFIDGKLPSARGHCTA